MKILSLFDGKSSGFTACELAGIDVSAYYSAEIDKYAIQVSDAIHPNQTRLGDVTKWREWDLDWSSINLILAGSPCQGFSFAGKQLAFDDPRSKLFFVFVDILNHARSVNPDLRFMLENVKMKKEHKAVITDALGVEPMEINSALVSAQNRQRLYWFNWDVEQPADRGVVLADVIEAGVVDQDKSYCIDANYFKGGNLKSYFEKHRRQLVFIGESHRKLTPRECFRLQTVPEHYIDKILACGVSNTRLYKVAGNGWTDEVIAHILRGLKK